MSIRGSRYFVTFIDDYTLHTCVCLIERKSKVKSLAERETRRKIKFLRSEGGKEYFSDKFLSYLKKEGIRHKFSCRYTPQQNSLAERTIEEEARAILEEKHIPKFYWAEAVRTAIYLQNRAFVNGGVPQNLAHSRVFGIITYVHVPKEKQRKLDAKAKKCILVSYSDEQKGYKSYNPRTKQARVSYNVVFDDSASW